MGIHFSKKPVESATSSTAAAATNTTDYLNAYSAACRVDADLSSFDSALQARTTTLITSLASGGVEVRSLSFDSLSEVTTTLLDMNQEVVKVILDCKRDIWRNKELFDLVEDYFDNSLRTLDFCAALERCLKRARDRHLLVHVALHQFEDADVDGKMRYARTLEELRSFKEAGDPFTEEFFQVFHSVYSHQMLMLERLQARKKKLDRKMKRIGSWRKVSGVIFAATFAAVLICSVVAAAVAAPPVAAALAAAASVPLGSMGKWIDSLMEKYENMVRGQREIVNCMSVGTFVAVKDLDGIRVLIDSLEVEIEGLMGIADVAAWNEERVMVAVEMIKGKLEVFMDKVEELGKQADNCSRDIRKARTVILQRIIKPPSH